VPSNEPGEQLQTIGAKCRPIAGERVKVFFIVNTLLFAAFSLLCTDSQDAEHTSWGIIRSFEYFGGGKRGSAGG
jgi:hypothetical protein